MFLRPRHAEGYFDKLNAEIVKVVNDPAFLDKNIARGLVPATGSPEDFAKTLKEGRVTAKQVVKESADAAADIRAASNHLASLMWGRGAEISSAPRAAAPTRH